MNKNTNSLNGKSLKLIAIITMLIDHIGLVIFYRALFLPANAAGLSVASAYLNAYHVCRIIGRVAFPIFAFLLVEGLLHTHDKKKYAIRLGIFAAVSQVPYYLAICGDGINYARLNVMVTLLIGVLMMWGFEKTREKAAPNYALQAIIVAVACAAAYFLDVDYGLTGVLVIAILYYFRYQLSYACILAAAALIIPDLSELPVILSFILIYFYNGKRGKQNKYFFYVFYPAHLLVLYLIYQIIMATCY